MVAASLASVYVLGARRGYGMRATTSGPVSKVTRKVRLRPPSPSFRKSMISSVLQCSVLEMIIKSPGTSKTRLRSRRRRASLALSTSHHKLNRRQNVRDLQKTSGGIVEDFAIEIRYERLRLQHIRESKGRWATGRGDDGVPRKRQAEQREWTAITTQRRGDPSYKESWRGDFQTSNV